MFVCVVVGGTRRRYNVMLHSSRTKKWRIYRCNLSLLSASRREGQVTKKILAHLQCRTSNFYSHKSHPRFVSRPAIFHSFARLRSMPLLPRITTRTTTIRVSQSTLLTQSTTRRKRHHQLVSEFFWKSEGRRKYCTANLQFIETCQQAALPKPPCRDLQKIYSHGKMC